MIKIEQFVAGQNVQIIGYKSFIPSLINDIYDFEPGELSGLAEECALYLGQLDIYGMLIPNIDELIKMYVLKEALESSRIEGTKTNMEEALLDEKDIGIEQREDWKEVNNYILAMNNAIHNLKVLPLSSRLLCKAHKDLMQSVRGHNKLPGEFRRSQNWIGGNSIQNASYIPAPWQEVQGLMSDLENFLHNPGTRLSKVMKAAIAHYQFETIHPFLDGNGRVGRLLITLFLIDQKVIRKPVLYLSNYFDKNRIRYYDSLTRVRRDNDIKSWLIFFMEGIIETCKSAIQSFEEILILKEKCKERILGMGKRIKPANRLLDYLFQKPIVKADEISRQLELSLKSTYNLIEVFQSAGILKEMTGYKRNRMYKFEEYFNIFDR